MLIAAIVFFLLAILVGFSMFSFVLLDKKVPRVLSFSHGPLALTGIVLLIINAYTHSTNMIVIITLFILAAMGGLFLFYKDLTGKPIPKWIAFGHGLLAFGTFLALVIYTVIYQ